MKKFRLLLVACLVLMFVQMSWAMCYHVEVENLFDIEGFGIEIITSDATAVATDFTLTKHIPSGWDAWTANHPTLSIQGANYFGDSLNSPGITALFEICSDTDFSLGSVLLAGVGGVPFDPATYEVVLVADTYTIRSPVPIPGAFVLLGSGLFGLVVVRRRKS